MPPTYLKLGLGDPCAGHIMVAELRASLWTVESLSSEGNLGEDPPTGSTARNIFKIMLLEKQKTLKKVRSQTAGGIFNLQENHSSRGAHPSIQAIIVTV